MNIFKNLKIHASQVGKIMTGTIKSSLTEKQAQMLDELLKKEKRTEKQEELLNELLAKRDSSPQISKTVLSFLKELAIEIETGRVKEIETDAMYRGTVYEEEAIKLLNRLTNKNYVKNQTQFENEFIIGTPDIISIDENNIKYVRDIKISQDIFTHPYYDSEVPNQDYFYQLQSYMWLVGAEYAYLDYVLLDSPEWLIQKKLKNKYFDLVDKGLSDEEIENFMSEFELKTRFNLIYSDLPLERRLKTFLIQRNDFIIEKIQQQIELIREFTF
ncbi:MAG: YqaJ viral recombinase family protein [Candidatus Dojkabacteria bacterium]|nr:YqaJ viral recombinase family protein [Candidatus Dojkabacteria bacterium]